MGVSKSYSVPDNEPVFTYIFTISFDSIFHPIVFPTLSKRPLLFGQNHFILRQRHAYGSKKHAGPNNGPISSGNYCSSVVDVDAQGHL